MPALTSRIQHGLRPPKIHYNYWVVNFTTTLTFLGHVESSVIDIFATSVTRNEIKFQDEYHSRSESASIRLHIVTMIDLTPDCTYADCQTLGSIAMPRCREAYGNAHATFIL